MKLFLLLLSYFVFSKRASKAIEFVEGFALGIEADIGNATECVDESILTFEDFEKAVADLDYGFRHLNVKRIEQGIQEFADGLHELTLAIKDCGVEELIEDIERLIKDIQEGVPGIIDIVVKEAVEIFHHHKELTKDFKDGIAAWKAEQWRASGYNFGKITGILLEGIP